jgi:hypothetical protein
MPELRRLGLLFLFGATVLVVCDGFHSYSDTTEYANPVLFRAAWWVPLLFATAGGGGGFAYTRAYRALGGPERLTPWPILIPVVLAFVGIYFASGFWRVDNGTKLVGLVLGALALFVIADRTWQGAVLALGAALVGFVVEATLVALGTFRYTSPDVLGIPFWLPGLYLASGPSVGQLARRVLDDGGGLRARAPMVRPSL